MRKAPAVLLLAALLLSGCNLIYKQPLFQGNLLDKKNVEQLQPGMTRDQVVSLLGTPPLADPFHADRWDYVATERRDHGVRRVQEHAVQPHERRAGLAPDREQHRAVVGEHDLDRAAGLPREGRLERPRVPARCVLECELELPCVTHGQ